MANYSRLLKVTSPLMRGEDVRAVQNKLNSLDYNVGKADGLYGNGSKEAVKRFQKSKGLSADGIVGKGTWSKLFGSTPSGGSSSNKHAYVTRTVNGCKISICISDQKIIQITNNSQLRKCIANPLRATDVATVAKARFKEVYGRSSTITTSSVAIEILGHVYPGQMFKAAQKLKLPKNIQDHLKARQVQTDRIDIGERGSIDTNRWVWDTIDNNKYNIIRALTIY